MHDPDRGDGPWPPLTVSRRSLLPDGNDGEFRRFVDGMVAFANRLQDVRAKIAAHMQVSPPQYRIVMTLARAETPEMTATALAAALDVSTAFIVTEAQKLGDMDLVTRRRNPDDARSFLLALSPTGRQKVRDAAPLTSMVNDTLFAAIDRQTMREMTELNAQLLQASLPALALFDVPTQTAPRPARKPRK